MLVGKPIHKFVGRKVLVIINFSGKGIGFRGKLLRDGERNHYRVITDNNAGYCFLRASDVHQIGNARDAIGGVRQIWLKDVEIAK